MKGCATSGVAQPKIKITYLRRCKMATFLEDLQKKLGELKPEDFIEPGAEFDPDCEYKRGEMTEEQKRLFTLWRNSQEERDKAGVKAKHTRTDEERAQALEILDMKIERSEDLKRLFWFSIGEVHQLLGRQAGVRKGFIVVEIESVREKKMKEFKKLLEDIPF